jgi:superfamily II DNA or RNA helicase
MGKRISEVIIVDEIRKWEIGDLVCIQAGTGMGKSYFIKNILGAFCKQQNKKILYLIHRKNCIDQFQEEINKNKKTDIIDIMSYQKIETYWRYHKIFDFSSYQYIVCDEFHYFLSDAAFNKFSDVSLNMILSWKSNIKIFMSATGDYMLRYLNNYRHIETKDYELPIEYNFIEGLTFFNKDETLKKFVEESIARKDKSIFFIQSAEKAYDLYKKYKKHCLFNCGKSDKHYRHVDKDKINKMLTQCKFEEDVLITTTCMDAGVKILDKEVKHIVCDVKDVGTLIQCIGRKRQLDDKDKIYLYIKAISNKQLGGMKSQLLKKIRMAKYFKDNGLQEFIKAYPKESDINNIVYDVQTEDKNKCSKKINEMMYFKCNIDIAKINKMLEYKKFGYCKYLTDLFQYKEKYRLINEDYTEESDKKYIDKLMKYLKHIRGKKLFQTGQEKLKKYFIKNGLKARSMGKHTINGYIKDLKLPYIIESYPDNMRRLENGQVNPNRGKRYWIVGEISFSEN